MSTQLDLSRVIFPNAVTVTDQEIDVSILNDRQRAFYLNLFTELVDFYQAKKKPRIVVGFAGPTGSGKSVIAAIFLDLARHLVLPFRLVTLGIDAFHYPNDYLAAHEKDGKTLKDIKGAPDTYDVAALETALKAYMKGETVSFPEYSRDTHEPVPGAYQVDEDNALLIVEGLWLLYEKEGWERIAPLLDFSIFITAEKEQVKNTVVVRHMRGGKSEEEANAYYDEVDAANYDLVMATKEKADKVIETYHTL